MKTSAWVFLNLDSTTSNPAFTYFSGFTGAGVVIILRKQKILITPQMELVRARKVFKGKILVWKRLPLTQQIADVVMSAKSIGVDGDTLPLNVYKALKKKSGKTIVDVSNLVNKKRLIKNAKEIAAIQQACKIGDQVLSYVFKHWKTFHTESDVAAALRAKTAQLGYKVSFDPIVASGVNAAIPHHEPQSKKLQNGFCVIDYGVFADNYASDMTRTVYIGKPSQKEKDYYEKVLKLQEECIELAKPGCKIANLVKYHDEGLKKIGFEPFHALGHGIGIEVHEAPGLSIKSKEVLKKNMVIAVEPGIYTPNKFGIRIEDTVLVQNNPQCLTKTSKKLVIMN